MGMHLGASLALIQKRHLSKLVGTPSNKKVTDAVVRWLFSKPALSALAAGIRSNFPSLKLHHGECALQSGARGLHELYVSVKASKRTRCQLESLGRHAPSSAYTVCTVSP